MLDIAGNLIDCRAEKYYFYGSSESAKIRAAQQLRSACMHFCLLASTHCVARLLHEFWPTRGNQKSARRIFLRFIPSACGRSLSNPDHLKELGLAVPGKGCILNGAKTRALTDMPKVSATASGKSYFFRTVKPQPQS